MNKPLNIGVVMDPIATITPYKDSTLAMMLAAQVRGHRLFYLETKDLYLDEGALFCHKTPVTAFDDNACWFELGERESASIQTLDVILMRKDPPFDSEFLFATYLLEQAQREGVLVVNDPKSIRDCNEKLFAQQFPALCPPTVVTKDESVLRAFLDKHKDIVVKPLDAMGGTGVYRLRQGGDNLNALIELSLNNGQTTVMVQQFIADVSKGDKRILLIDGEPAEYVLNRIPQAGDIRANLAAGGKGVVEPLNDRDQEICCALTTALKSRGLLFVGIDVIGGFLTEINVTSPTCIREIDAAQGTKIAEKLIKSIENLQKRLV